MIRSTILVCVTTTLLALPAYVWAQDFPPALVQTEPVTTIEFHQQLTLIGRSTARAESRIVSEITGRVMKINATEGRWIKTGGPLVTIDPRRAQLSLGGGRS